MLRSVHLLQPTMLHGIMSLDTHRATQLILSHKQLKANQALFVDVLLWCYSGALQEWRWLLVW